MHNGLVDVYAVAARRTNKLRPTMGEAVHPTTTILKSITLTFPSSTGTLQPDGRVSSIETPDGFLIIPTITGVEEVVGTGGGSDPNAQAECDYIALYSSEEASSSRSFRSC